jgi:predicted lipid-binding transport protein (Tim44 family)
MKRDSRAFSALMGGTMGALFATVLIVSNLGVAGAIALATFGVVLAVSFGVMVWVKIWRTSHNRKSATERETIS